MLKKFLGLGGLFIIISCSDSNLTSGELPEDFSSTGYWHSNPDLQTVFDNPADGLNDSEDSIALANHYLDFGEEESRDYHFSEGQSSFQQSLMVSTSSFISISSSLVSNSSSLEPQSSAVKPGKKLMRLGFMELYRITDDAMKRTRFDRLTHISLFHIAPNADGTLDKSVYTGNAELVSATKEQAKANGVKLVVTVGGHGKSANFPAVSSDPALRAKFATELVAFAKAEGLGGIDIDWEYPSKEQGEDYTALVKAVHDALGAENMTLSVDFPTVQHVQKEYFSPTMFEHLDYINLMAYDMLHIVPKVDHARLDVTLQTIDYWLGVGAPASKVVLGVPFYAKRWDTETSTKVDMFWRDFLRQKKFNDDLVELAPFTSEADRATKVKTVVDKGMAGLMYWALFHDTEKFDYTGVNPGEFADQSLAIWYDEELKKYGH